MIKIKKTVYFFLHICDCKKKNHILAYLPSELRQGP